MVCSLLIRFAGQSTPEFCRASQQSTVDFKPPSALAWVCHFPSPSRILPPLLASKIRVQVTRSCRSRVSRECGMHPAMHLPVPAVSQITNPTVKNKSQRLFFFPVLINTKNKNLPENHPGFSGMAKPAWMGAVGGRGDVHCPCHRSSAVGNVSPAHTEVRAQHWSSRDLLGVKSISKHAAGFGRFQSVLCDAPYSSPLFGLIQQRLLLIRP